VQNRVRFGAKWSAFWCKMQGKMPLYVVRFAAKCESKSINIHCNGINKTFSNHETHGPEGQNDR